MLFMCIYHIFRMLVRILTSLSLCTYIYTRTCKAGCRVSPRASGFHRRVCTCSSRGVSISHTSPHCLLISPRTGACFHVHTSCISPFGFNNEKKPHLLNFPFGWWAVGKHLQLSYPKTHHTPTPMHTTSTSLRSFSPHSSRYK